MTSHVDFIRAYFGMAMSQRDILFALAANHGTVISIRTLKPILQRATLYRRKNYSDVTAIVLFIYKKVKRSGGLFGYRWMHTKCLENGLSVSKNEVAIIMQTVDANGVALRQQRTLRRMRYFAKGRTLFGTWTNGTS